MKWSRPRRASLATVCLLLTFHVSDTLGAPPAPYKMVRIPSALLRIGSGLDDLIFAMEECERARKRYDSVEECSSDDFASELNDGAALAIPGFFLDRAEVSRRAYDRCVRAARCRPPLSHHGAELLLNPTAPVVFISFHDAVSFCSFRGARLPTEAEFESAARGSSGRSYPWGTWFHPKRTNFGKLGTTQTNPIDGYELLAPVLALSDGQTPQGVLNLAGNAAEWTASRFAPHHSPKGTAQKISDRVVKGGSFLDPPQKLRGSARQALSPESRNAWVGFRCALSKKTGENLTKGKNL